jgi:hypothetical protein
MKINAEMPSVLNLVKKDEEYQKRTRDNGEGKSTITDVVSVENKAASSSHVENVDEARVLLSDVMKDMGKTSSSVHNLNHHRISQLIN